MHRTMANIHTFVVRTAVKAGMYTLPAREHFLKSIGEPECESSAHLVSRHTSPPSKFGT